MALDDPAVITCAISGTIANREQCPAIPYTPEEYAAEARRIVDEAGVHIHIHARTRDGRPSYEVEAFEAIIELLEAMRRLGIKPEQQCFDVGHVGSLAPLVDMGLLEAPLHADFVMGVVGGVPASARNLAAMADNMPPAPDGGPKHHWGVIGIGRDQWMLVAAALTLGGSIRVGLEDNFYLPDGEMARSNGELIAKARQMTEEVGRRPATVEEARELLGVRQQPDDSYGLHRREPGWRAEPV